MSFRRLPIEKLAAETRDSEVLVIGGGVAGLAAALALAPRPVTLLAKAPVGAGGSSPWAQGGVAGALGDDDSPRLHALDTLRAGAGLCDEAAVSRLVEEGPQRLRALIEAAGARFDRRPGGELHLGREGAHSRRRILHAGGDATGAEMIRSLRLAVTSAEHVAIAADAEALDLVLDPDRRVLGALARHGGAAGRQIFHRARSVVLATGGFGQLYLKTTNPAGSTGDGLALAARAGARLSDLEFVQFHPTALDVPRDPLPLCTEALRGEGARLIDARGERFMPSEHELAELAPRDIVARALWRRQRDSGERVFLDARRAVGAAFPERFPTVWAQCLEHGLDPRHEPIPVTPAAHYAMAGAWTDADGRTSLEGLWACGEVAASGVHGANRLASNSLLEALVFGQRVALDIADREGPGIRAARGVVCREARFFDGGRLRDLRRLMWGGVGLVRERAGLESALESLIAWSVAAPAGALPGAGQNLWTVARLVTAASLVREESRGGHYRADFPQPDLAWRRRLSWTYRPAAAVGDLPLQRSEPARPQSGIPAAAASSSLDSASFPQLREIAS
ncbi:MAG: L-aspartate oxidase [Acidobacteriota bacterium]